MPEIVRTRKDLWPHYRHDDGSCETYGCTPIITEKSVDELQREWAEDKDHRGH